MAARVSSLDPEGELLLIRAKPGWAWLGSSRRMCVQARIRVDPADISGQDMPVGPAAQHPPATEELTKLVVGQTRPRWV